MPTLYVQPQGALLVEGLAATRSAERSGDAWRLALERAVGPSRSATLEVSPERCVLTLTRGDDLDEGVSVAARIDGEQREGTTDDLGEWACPLPERYQHLAASKVAQVVALDGALKTNARLTFENRGVAFRTV